MPLRSIDDIPFPRAVLNGSGKRLHLVGEGMHPGGKWSTGPMQVGTECGKTLVLQNGTKLLRWSEVLEEYVRTSGRPDFAVCYTCSTSLVLQAIYGLVALAGGTSTTLRRVVRNRRGQF